jgi:NAD(P)-dependent dehydrogenase (short-subunit alcohol dehydrogenase family)
MPTVLITGAARGLGLEFVRQYAADGWQVVGTCRNLDHLDDHEGLFGNSLSRLNLYELDVSDFGEIDDVASRIEEREIDLLICNAGIMGPRHVEAEGDAEEWLETLQINAVAPVLLARRLRTRLAAVGGKAVAITSRMGSIADNTSGGSLAYRSSKAALNAAWKSLSFEFARDGIASAVFHPGWVQTDMGGKDAPLTPEESIAGMRRVIAGLKVGAFGFYNYDGATIPW